MGATETRAHANAKQQDLPSSTDPTSLRARSVAKGAVVSARPRVSFIGGIDRIERQIVTFGEQVGVDVEVHSGRTSGSSTNRLAALVHRSDLIVIVTGTNSHNAVHVVKREAAKSGVPVRIVTFCGAASARALLAELARAPAPAA